MGEAYVDNHLKSSEWCQYNVPRIHVPEGIESMEAKENLAAAEIVDVCNRIQLIKAIWMKNNLFRSKSTGHSSCRLREY